MTKRYLVTTAFLVVVAIFIVWVAGCGGAMGSMTSTDENGDCSSGVVTATEYSAITSWVTAARNEGYGQVEVNARLDELCSKSYATNNVSTVAYWDCLRCLYALSGRVYDKDE